MAGNRSLQYSPWKSVQHEICISHFHFPLENVMITWLEEVVFLLVSCPPDPLSFHTFCKHLQEPIEIANCCMPSSINQWKSAKSLPICPPQLRVGCLGGRPPLLLPWWATRKNEKLLASFDLDVVQQQEKVEKNMMVLALTWTQKGSCGT